MKATKKSKRGLLVPLVEEFMMEDPPSDEEDDLNFLSRLQKTEQQRERQREALRLYSPSALGECMRKVYLGRHFKRLGISKGKYPMAVRHTFEIGQYIHRRLHLMMRRMERWYDDPDVFEIYAHEISVMSKHGDHGGTLDLVAKIHREPTAIDFKGLNAWSASRVQYGKIPRGYKIQLGDYMMLWNSQRRVPFRIERGVVFVENKGWVQNGSTPFPWSEEIVHLSKVRWEVRARLALLREHEYADTIPEPACVRTNQAQFQQCPFSGFCLDDVRKIQNERMDKTKLSIATPARVRSALKRRKR